MGKYLKQFETTLEYTTYTASTEFVTPNVSLCKDENGVHYSSPNSSPIDYSTKYLTFVAKADGTFKFSGNSINYSIDEGNTWTQLASNTNTPTVASGSKIMWKAELTPTSNGIGTFSSSAQFDVEGNPMSLLYGDDFVGQTSLSGKKYAFFSLFNGNTNVVSAENMSLLATTLADYCYWNMFFGCTSLTTAPELPATTLATGYYQGMFFGCTRLNSITCLATKIMASSSTRGWLSGVASSGTFTKAASMTSWTRGSDGIPTNWSVVDAS